MEEIWKDIPRYGGKFQVSNLGNVKNSITGKPFSLVTNNRQKPYKRIGISNNGKRDFILVHRLVAEAFIPNPDNLPQVNHKNEIKYDNRVENLEWITNRDNARYSHARQIKQFFSGVLIRTWNSLAEIKDSGQFNISKVSECCNNKRPHHKGFNWVY